MRTDTGQSIGPSGFAAGHLKVRLGDDAVHLRIKKDARLWSTWVAKR